MSKQKIQPLIIVVIILTAFIVILYTMKDRMDKPVMAESWENVKQYQYNTTPGLKRAEKLGLAKKLDINVDIPGTERKLTINEIWYNKNKVYVFYGVDIDRLEELPLLNFDLIAPRGDTPSMNNSFPSGGAPSEGVVYNNRYYFCVTALPIQHNNGQVLNEIDEILLDNLSVLIGDQQYPLEPITIKMNYKENQIKDITVPINQSFSFEKQDFEWEKLVIGTTENKLYFSYMPRDGQAINDISGKAITDTGEEKKFYELNWEGEDLYSVKLEPFNDYPSELTLKLDSLKMSGDDSFSFKIDAENFTKKNWDKNKEVELHQKLKTIKNTDIYLERLVFRENDFIFDILYSPAKGKSQKLYLVESIPNIKRDFEQALEKKRPLADQYFLNAAGNIIKVVNEKGEEAEYGSRGSGPERQYNLALSRSYVENSDRLMVHIEKLLYEIKVEKEMKIDIPKGR